MEKNQDSTGRGEGTGRRAPQYRDTSPHAARTIGDYEIGPEIGHGSFASVFKGHHRKTGLPVAIKAVSRSKLTKRLLENLETEIKILKTMKHENVVQLLDCQKSESHFYLIMEFCSSGDLSHFIRRNAESIGLRGPAGGLKEYVVRHFLRQLAHALEFLRSKNLIHRDIKPQNLLLMPSPLGLPEATHSDKQNEQLLPTLKIADFGFARILPSQSMANTLCGSPLYMAPEILRYEKYDAKADLWSVGAVLYEMCYGRPPFRADNHIELLKRIERRADKIQFPDEREDAAKVMRGTIGADIKDLIRKLLKQNPVERITFEEFFMHSCTQPASTNTGVETERERASGGVAGAVSSLGYRHRFPIPGFVSGMERLESDATSKPTYGRIVQRVSTGAARVMRRASNGGTLPGTSAPPQADAHTRPTAMNTEPARRTVHPPRPSAQDLFPFPNSLETDDGSTQGIPISQQIVPSALEGDIILTAKEDADYVLVERRVVELNLLADDIAASPLVKPRQLSSEGLETAGNQGSPRTTVRRLTQEPTSSLEPPSPHSSAKEPSLDTGVAEVDSLEDRTIMATIDTCMGQAHAIFKFADQKFTQLLDLPVSTSRQATNSESMSAEAKAAQQLAAQTLALYLRALTSLQRGIDTAAAYWEKINQANQDLRGAAFHPIPPLLNEAMQWMRTQYNTAIEKANYAKRRLPPDGSNLVIHVETILYSRALEISRDTAVRELVGDNLPNCSTAYQHAIWMLTAILDNPESNIGPEHRRIVEDFVQIIQNRLQDVLRRQEERIASGTA